MDLTNQADHMAVLSLMMVGVLTKRLIEIDQLDHATAVRLHKLVLGVRTHAASIGINDLNSLFDSLSEKLKGALDEE